MKQLAVLSGKGGTGKTTVVASLAKLLAPTFLVDCDVDASNLALLLAGPEEPSFTVLSGQEALVNAECCTGCGECIEKCRFDAVRLEGGVAQIQPLLCEGCSVCSLVCPVQAIERSPRQAGWAWIRTTTVGPLVHARLAVAQDNSGHLVTYLRDLSQRIAGRVNAQWMLLDGPPGLGCPVQATLAGVDCVLVVVEPSASSAADLERLLELLARLSHRAAVLINKANLVPDGEGMLAPVCERFGVPIVGRLPYLEEVPRCLARRQVPAVTLDAVREGLTGVLGWLEQQRRGSQQKGDGNAAPFARTS